MNWKFETRKINQIKPWSKNPRRITKQGMEQLDRSISKFGLPEPIVLNTDGTIIGGHARMKVLQKQGVGEIFCAIPERKLTGKELEELNIRLNKNIAGEFDFDILANEFDGENLIDLGFNKQELMGNFGNIETQSGEKEIVVLTPYKKMHIMISFVPADLIKIQELLEQIKNTEGIEYETNAN